MPRGFASEPTSFPQGIAAIRVTPVPDGGRGRVWDVGMAGGPGGRKDTNPAASAQAAASAVAGADGIQRVRIEETDGLRFVPDVVRAHPGVIELTFHNGGVTPHGATIDASGMRGILEITP